MLQALQDIDDRRARLALSRVSERLMPPSLIQGPRVAPDPNTAPIIDAVLAEIARRIEGTRPPTEEARRDRMLDSISKEISEFVFARSEPQPEIRKRLGWEGRLPVSLYALDVSPKFIQQEKAYGVSKAHAENAVRNCDLSQHFFASPDMGALERLGSLFVQRSPSKKSAPNLILVKCDRVGDRLLIDDAYRIFDGELDLSDARTPLDILRKFVDRFGTEIEVYLVSPTERVLVERNKIFREKLLQIPENGYAELLYPGAPSLRFPYAADGRCEISLAYSIKMNEYVAQLNRHGINAEVLDRSTTSTLVRQVPVATRIIE